MFLKKLTIIIPVYNEATTINELLHKVEDISLTNKVEKQLIIVDDYSIDNSKEEIEKFIDSSENKNDIVFIDHKKNVGKGGAIKSAILKADGNYSVIQDADLELNPEEINNLLEPILNNQADVVYSSRFINNKKQKKERLTAKIDPEIADRAAILSNLKKQVAIGKVNAQRAAVIEAQKKTDGAK